MSRRGGGRGHSVSGRAKELPVVYLPAEEVEETGAAGLLDVPEPTLRKESNASEANSNSYGSGVDDASDETDEGGSPIVSDETLTVGRRRRPGKTRRASPLEVEDEPNFWKIYEQTMAVTNAKLNSCRKLWRRLRPWVKIVLLVACFCAVLIPLLFLSRQSIHDNREQLALRLEHFFRDADKLVDSITADGHAHRRRTVKAMLRYAGEVLIGRRLHRPAVFLVAHKKTETVDALLSGLRSLFAKHALHYVELDIRSQGRGELEDSVSDRMEARTALALKGIDRLQSTAPLTLHSLADPETSPYMGWNALFITTVQLDDTSKRDDGDCSSRITDHLMTRWRGGLSDDKIYPIISRLSAITICLD